mmetsp:Transcript_19037/g.45752  ORF Transcript_19037/g.45752 Transcript_19037/m.45752 type:complete len:278 (+) Transcript_19037:1291-2124(+)
MMRPVTRSIRVGCTLVLCALGLHVHHRPWQQLCRFSESTRNNKRVRDAANWITDAAARALLDRRKVFEITDAAATALLDRWKVFHFANAAATALSDRRQDVRAPGRVNAPDTVGLVPIARRVQMASIAVIARGAAMDSIDRASACLMRLRFGHDAVPLSRPPQATMGAASVMMVAVSLARFRPLTVPGPAFGPFDAIGPFRPFSVMCPFRPITVTCIAILVSHGRSPPAPVVVRTAAVFIVLMGHTRSAPSPTVMLFLSVLGRGAPAPAIMRTLPLC